MVLGLWFKTGKTANLRTMCRKSELSYVIIRHFCILLTTSMLSFKADVYIKTLISANKSKACLSDNRNPVITSWWVLGEKCLPAAIAQLGWNKQCKRKTCYPSKLISECDSIKKSRDAFCSLSHRNTPMSLPGVKELSALWQHGSPRVLPREC